MLLMVHCLSELQLPDGTSRSKEYDVAISTELWAGRHEQLPISNVEPHPFLRLAARSRAPINLPTANVS